MKKFVRTATIALVNLLVLFLLLEAAGLVMYFRTDGALFYTRPSQAESTEDRFEELAHQPVSVYRLQPYWGYSVALNRQPIRGRPTNNYGFTGAIDFPLAHGDDQVIIGIFGGSVAAQFTYYGRERLVEVLSEDPRFTGRKIRVLNFAGGGYKQPQQLQILTYFLSQGQQFDLVINIDGFNEVSLTPFNLREKIHPAMPSSLHLLPLVNLLDHTTLTNERLAALQRVTGLRDRISGLEQRMARTRSAAFHLLYKTWHTRLDARHSLEVQRFQELESGTEGRSASLVALAGTEGHAVNEERLYEAFGAAWAESSLLMHQLLSARGTAYHHFLQPNQYAGQRVFSAEEAAIAHREDAPLRGHAARGYPILKELGRQLVTDGVRFHDATSVFDDEPAAVYADDCCHYNQLGNELLAEFIAREVLAGWPH